MRVTCYIRVLTRVFCVDILSDVVVMSFQVVTKVMEVRAVTIRISKSGKERRERLLSQKLCLVCENQVEKCATRRGLCSACRQFVRRMIGKCERTEESFIREGKLLELDGSRGGAQASEKRRALRATS